MVLAVVDGGDRFHSADRAAGSGITFIIAGRFSIYTNAGGPVGWDGRWR